MNKGAHYYFYSVKFAFALIGVMLWLVSCNNQKYLADNEVLYTGAEIKLKKQGDFTFSKELNAELNELIYPKPNQVLFGFARPKLWVYNTTKEPSKEKGIRYWKKYKLGAPPVLFKETNPDRIEKLLTNRLNNHGYFQAKVDYKIESSKKQAKVIYTINLNSPYTIDSIFFPADEGELSKKIKATQKQSLLEKGDLYNLNTLKNERERISKNMRELGFYYFEPNFLIFEIDSTVGNQQVAIYLSIKKNIKDEFLKVKKLGAIYVYPNYDLRNNQDSITSDTLYSNNTYYLMQDSSICPEIVTDAVYLKTGNIYSETAHDLTVNRLIGLGVYQFVSIKYVPDSANKVLSPNIQLTPNTKKSIRLELSGTTKSNGFTGPGFQASFSDKNLFRGAELLTINLLAGYEAQFSSNTQNLNSFELGLNTELSIPRFLIPFGIKTVSNRYTPFTNFRVGFRTLNRLNYYQLNSFDFSIGYKWRETKTKYHELLPISINYVQLAQSSEAFEDILSENPLVRRSFEEQFIIGTEYHFIYDNQLSNTTRNNFFFKGGIDLSGNIAQLLNTIGEDVSFGEETNYELLGINFSQYARLETVYKYFLKFNNGNVLANRLIMGAGIPFGNATTLPYIKQFFTGGGNSIRAFQARSIGPGTYRRTAQDQNGNIFIDQSGDLKLEINTEYRFDIYSIFKAAIFIDAGNVWLFNEDPLRPGGDFNTDQFLNELAVGTGFGLRIDPDFFVIRLDLGVPLRKPFLPEGDRWVFDTFGKDAVLNIAIGYPF